MPDVFPRFNPAGGATVARQWTGRLLDGPLHVRRDRRWGLCSHPARSCQQAGVLMQVFEIPLPGWVRIHHGKGF
ncbi:MAG: hypothetical protein ACKOBA_05830, partial [Limnohabitans sp.]